MYSNGNYFGNGECFTKCHYNTYAKPYLPKCHTKFICRRRGN